MYVCVPLDNDDAIMWPSEKETEKDTEREAKKIIIYKIIAQ